MSEGRGQDGRLRIALVSTPFLPVPPAGYGGTELVVAELAQALQASGAEVVVYSTGDSRLDGVEIRSYYAEAQWPPDRDVDALHAAWSLRDIARDPRGFDAVHLHSVASVELSRLCPYPALYTIHHDTDGRLSAIYRRCPWLKLVAISRSQARREPAPVWSVVHHGLSPERYPAMEDQGYLLYLGRYSRVKAPHLAIEVAERAGLPLVMAGEPHEQDYYDRQLRPLIQRHGVLELGPGGGARKAALLARARALVFPIQWEEPFGLVMIESMLCGVPVLATRRGSASEVVEDGITGVLCDDPTELVSAARIADKLFDREAIRERARQRWSSARMAADYLRLYRQLAARGGLRIDRGAPAGEDGWTTAG